MKKATKKEVTPIQEERNPTNPFKYIADNGKEYKLTIRQKLFSELYLELEGNGTQAVIDAGYNCLNKRGEVNRNLAKSIASDNLTKPDVYGYINVLLTREGFNSDNVDKQHLFLINQHADLSAKSKGIDMFNRLRGRYPKDQLEVSLITKYKTLSDTELANIIDGEVIEDS